MIELDKIQKRLDTLVFKKKRHLFFYKKQQYIHEVSNHELYKKYNFSTHIDIKKPFFHFTYKFVRKSPLQDHVTKISYSKLSCKHHTKKTRFMRFKIKLPIVTQEFITNDFKFSITDLYELNEANRKNLKLGLFNLINGNEINFIDPTILFNDEKLKKTFNIAFVNFIRNFTFIVCNLESKWDLKFKVNIGEKCYERERILQEIKYMRDLNIFI